MSGINYDLKRIRAFAFDVDGVLSASSIPLHPSGEPMRVINIKDGYAMQLAVKLDACADIIDVADYVSPCAGGMGCARDLIEQVLRARGDWMKDRHAFGW